MKPVTPRQLVLDLPHRPALAREDFLVSPANAAAVAMIDRWPQWHALALVLAGPPGSGKTHLAEVWRKVSGAPTIEAGSLSTDQVPGLLGSGALVIENLGRAGLDETALFHLLNHARDRRAHVLLTSEGGPTTWGVKLPDLVSRLRALPVAVLGAPDDALLRGVLVKHFADRQLAVDESVVSYLLLRMPRSLGAARALVAEIDRRALEERHDVTRAFAALVLQEVSEPGLFGEDDPLTT